MCVCVFVCVAVHLKTASRICRVAVCSFAKPVAACKHKTIRAFVLKLLSCLSLLPTYPPLIIIQRKCILIVSFVNNPMILVFSFLLILFQKWRFKLMYLLKWKFSFVVDESESITVCVCSGWVEHKGSGRVGGGGFFTVFVCARGKVGVTPPSTHPNLGPIKARNSNYAPKKTWQTEAPICAAGSTHKHHRTHKSSQATKSIPRWRRSKVRLVRHGQWKLTTKWSIKSQLEEMRTCLSISSHLSL